MQDGNHKQIIQASLTRKTMNIADLNKQIGNKTKLCNNKRPPTPKTNPILSRIQNKQDQTILERIQHFAGNHGNIYVVFGGVGDLILVLAECYKDVSAKLIFFANNNAAEFGKHFLNHFKVHSYIHPNIMGSKTANHVVDYLKGTGRLKNSAHLAQGLYFTDWSLNTEIYKNRMVRSTSWLNDVGVVQQFKSKKTMLISPSGSFRSQHKQKFLSDDEYTGIVNYYLKHNYHVISTGADKDYNFYTKINHENHFWITADKLVEKNQKINPLKFHDFLQLINSASEVISVDTWLKTYTCLAGIPTKVIPNRSNNDWLPFGVDPSDYIFLNEDFWPSMRLTKPEEIISQILI